MKTLTTLTAVAALVAGLSIAQAQNSTLPGGNQKTAPEAAQQNNAVSSKTDPSLNKKGAKTAATAKKVTGNGKFCLEQSTGGGLNCKFASMEACQKEATPNNAQCQPNPNAGTTGAK
jgi:hypothetical protein